MAKSFTQTGIESDLHEQITKEAARHKQSFSAQIREYRDHVVALEEKVSNLMSENKKWKKYVEGKEQ